MAAHPAPGFHPARNRTERVGEIFAGAFLTFFPLYLAGHMAAAHWLRGWPL